MTMRIVSVRELVETSAEQERELEMMTQIERELYAEPEHEEMVLARIFAEWDEMAA
jgi:hypothetical protein